MFKINKDQKAMHELNEFQRQECEKIKQLSEAEEVSNPESYLSSKMTNFKRMGQRHIPGFKILQERVLSPLMVATEKVVDYYYNQDVLKEEEQMS
mmetsp:Transcript_29386/g.44400  ORF Transcript_29386/g.44400 Transcript_29386/m.44400 type:complete len:95 (+) Transcript_29386:1522-1806(+)